MRRQSQTQIAVLGALSIEPMSGYALRKAITETLGHFWSESFGQIYPTLGRLEADGLVARDGTGRTSGSTFRLTAAGRRRLTALLRQPIASTPPRNGTLLHLFFGGLLGREVCEGILREARARARVQLDAMATIRAEIEAEIEVDDDARYRLITVLAGERFAAAQIAWADESLALLAR